MRVRFLADYAELGREGHAAGAVIDLDPGLACELIVRGIAAHFPRTEAEIIAAASAPKPGDEHRSAQEITRRTAELITIGMRLNAETPCE